VSEINPFPIPVRMWTYNSFPHKKVTTDLSHTVKGIYKQWSPKNPYRGLYITIYTISYKENILSIITNPIGVI